LAISKGEVFLLGKKVGYGSGVGIWSVRQNFGLVSTELHSSFAQKREGSITVIDVIGSVFQRMPTSGVRSEDRIFTYYHIYSPLVRHTW